MIDRRKFLKGSVAALAAAAMAPEIFSMPQGKKLRNFGFISGIIDKELKGDWKSVLKQVASFGYTEFETGRFLGDSPAKFLKFCKDIALRPVAGGITFNGNDNDLAKDFEMLHKLKMQYAVTYWPWYTGGPFTLDDCKKSAERLNYLGKKCSENGVIFCWHNHNKEFIQMEQGLPFDFIMNNTDSTLVKCEIDIYWVRKGGADPLAMLRKYKGRYAILHIKDMAAGESQDFECPGSGIIDFVPIFREAELQGINHHMVERDNVQDGLACLKSSAQYLKNISF
jgi:sugar phosphate isomerase/epimerase